MSERVVREMVAEWKRRRQEVFVPLAYHPGDLAEVDFFDLSAYRSKSVETIDPATVGTVITLCAEAVCPVFLGNVRRIHWPIQDPASNDPAVSPEQMLTRFRTTRDQIQGKVETLELFSRCR